MRCRSMVTLAGVLALVACGCSSSSHRTTPPPASSTSPASTAGGSSGSGTSSTSTPTSTTKPAAAGGCRAETNPDRVSVAPQPGAWIQMVGANRGYAVMGRAVVATVDGQHWTQLYRAPEELSFVDATDASHVWAVGAKSLFASADGGAHWRVSSASLPILAVHFVGADRGWAVAKNSLLASTDGGRSWRAVSSPCPVDRVCFDDAQHGWVATHTDMYSTNDGGAHWTRALAGSDPIAANGVASDVQCAPDHSAWVLFDSLNGAAGSRAYIGYRCPASGACRIVAQLPPSVSGNDAGPGSTPGPFSVIDPHTAVFVGYTGPLDQPMSVMLLGDDGRQRDPVRVVPDNPLGAEPRAVSFVSRDRGWIVDVVGANASHILATTNGGTTWAVQYRASVG